MTIPNSDHFGDIDKSCNGLIELPCAEDSGLLWVHPNPDGHLDVRALLGALADEFPSFDMNAKSVSVRRRLIRPLNWKFANDTFGETYHFGKLHKDTLGRLYYGNNLHFEEFGRHHRFVTANRGMESHAPVASGRMGYRQMHLCALSPFSKCAVIHEQGIIDADSHLSGKG